MISSIVIIRKATLHNDLVCKQKHHFISDLCKLIFYGIQNLYSGNKKLIILTMHVVVNGNIDSLDLIENKYNKLSEN